MCNLSPGPVCTVPLTGQIHVFVTSPKPSVNTRVCTHAYLIGYMGGGVTLLLPALTASALIILGCRRLGRHLRGSRHARSRKSRGRELQSAQQSSLHLRSGTHAVRLCREDMLPQRDVVGETAVLQA